MNIGHAVNALKDGYKVSREGWNGNRFDFVPNFMPYTPTERVEYIAGVDTVYILLSNGQVAVCDGSDYDKVCGHKWTFQKGYAAITDNASKPRHTIKMHQVIIPTVPEGMCIDHINGNRLDNRRINLRIVTLAQNTHNSKSRTSSTSQYKGVSYDKSRGKWIASIQLQGSTKHLGRFDIEEDAANAYDNAAIEAYGKYAKLNHPEKYFAPNMFLWLKPATTVKSEWCKDPTLKDIADENGGEVEALGTICMKTADNKILTGWLASQTDILADDWFII